MTDHPACCTPPAERETSPLRKTGEPSAVSPIHPAAEHPDRARPMVPLEGGRFLMGTDYKGAFPRTEKGRFAL